VKGKLILVVSVLLLGDSAHTTPLGSAFTYQGRLDQNGQAAPNGIYQMIFAAFTEPMGGTIVGSNFVTSVAVTNGLFTLDLNFGSAVFAGEARWLETLVRSNTATPFVLLAPRTRIAPTPNAIYASTAGTVTNRAVQVDQLGTVGASPSPGQVLGYNGSSLVWTNPSASGDLTLPYFGSAFGINPIFHIHNSGSASIADAILGTTDANRSQVAGVRGIANSPVGVVVGVYGVATDSPDGTGIVGHGGATGGYFTATRPGGRAGVFDGTVTVNGNVGIGTTAPTAPLHVNSLATGNSVLAALLEPSLSPGSFNQIYLGRAGFENQCATLTYTYEGGNSPLSRFSLGLYNNSYTFNVLGNGDVGIGTANPRFRLHVAGRAGLGEGLTVYSGYPSSVPSVPLAVVDGTPTDPGHGVMFKVANRDLEGYGWYLEMRGAAYKTEGGTSWNTPSDRRLKQGVRPYEPGLNEVLQLRPVRFRYREDKARGLTSAREEVGLIAQDVREVIPDAVTEAKDGYLTLQADPIHWAAVNAIRELNEKLQQKDARIAAMERRLENLEQLIGSQQARVR